MKILILSVVFSLFLTSCYVMTRLPTEETANTYFEENDNMGIMVGSVAIKKEKPFHDSYMFHFNTEKNIEAKNNNREDNLVVKNEAVFFKPIFNADTTEGDYAIYYYILKRKPDKYNFYLARFCDTYGYVINEQKVKTDFPFEIKPNQITYVGRIILENTEKKLVRIDNLEKDIEFFKNTNKYLQWNKIVKANINSNP